MTDKISDSIEMVTQAISILNKNINDLNQQVKEIKIEMQGIRRNSGYLRNIAETLQKGLTFGEKNET